MTISEPLDVNAGDVVSVRVDGFGGRETIDVSSLASFDIAPVAPVSDAAGTVWVDVAVPSHVAGDVLVRFEGPHREIVMPLIVEQNWKTQFDALLQDTGLLMAASTAACLALLAGVIFIGWRERRLRRMLLRATWR